jgi:hypothetical protein
VLPVVGRFGCPCEDVFAGPLNLCHPPEFGDVELFGRSVPCPSNDREAGCPFGVPPRFAFTSFCRVALFGAAFPGVERTGCPPLRRTSFVGTFKPLLRIPCCTRPTCALNEDELRCVVCRELLPKNRVFPLFRIVPGFAARFVAERLSRVGTAGTPPLVKREF